MPRPNGTKLGLGKIQRLIVEHLLECGGAASTEYLLLRLDRYPGRRAQISRSARRLEERGLLKRVHRARATALLAAGVINPSEYRAVLIAADQCMHADMFWVLTDKAMNMIEEEVGG